MIEDAIVVISSRELVAQYHPPYNKSKHLDSQAYLVQKKARFPNIE